MSVRLLVLLLLASAGCEARAQSTTRPLNVVTFNIRYANPGDGPDVWLNRVETVSKFIAAHDIAGLQEVTFSQLGDLRDRLSDFDSYGVGRDDGVNAGEHAVIFYRRDRFELTDKGTFWLSENPEKVGAKGWDAALPRTCTWIVLRERSTNDQIWVANTHFDHRGAIARARSGTLIRRVAGQRAGSLPVIVMGDFNCLPDSDPYRALTAELPNDPNTLLDARLISKTAAQGPASTWNGFREVIPDRIIDHVFVRGPIEVVDFETLDPKTPSGRFASDHLPVRVSIEFVSTADAPDGKSGE